MKNKLLHITLLLFFTKNFFLHAQFHAPRFQRLTTAEGLPNGEVRQIREDKSGFIWFATAQGICRFDGYKVQLLRGQKPVLTEDLSNDRPMFFDWDHQNRWWIGSDWEGMRLYDPTKATLIHLRNAGRTLDFPLDKHLDTLPNAAVSCIFTEDKKRIWIGTYEDGLSIFDLKTNRLDRSTQFGQDLFKGSAIQKIDRDAQGNIWVAATKKGLYRFDIHTLKWTVVSNHKDIRSFSFDTEGGVWFVSAFQIFHYKATSGVFEDPYPNIRKSSTTETNFLKIHCDKQKRIWIGTTNGLLLLQNKSIPPQLFKHDPLNSYSLVSNYVQEIFEDSKSNIWLACGGNGISMIPNSFNRIQVFQNLTNTFEVRDVAIAPDSTLYAVTQTHLVTSQFPYYQTNFIPIEKILPVGHEAFSKIEIGRNGQIYIATTGSIWQYQPAQKRSRFICAIDEKAHFVQQRAAASLNIWGDTLLTFSQRDAQGLHLFNLKKNKKQTITDAKRGFNTVFTEGVVQDENGVFWSNSFAGLLRMGQFWGINDTCRVAHYLFKWADYINVNNGGSPLLKIQNTLWWGRDDGGGLNVMFTKDNSYRNFLKEQGLFDNSVSTLVHDKAGYIWAGTYLGISRIQIPNNFLTVPKLNVQNFSFADGLPHNSVICSTITPDGSKVFVGTVGGLAMINTEGLEDTFAPKIVFNNLFLFNTLVNPNDSLNILNNDINQTSLITLRHDQAFFTLEVSGLNFINPMHTRYAYRLSGLHDDWIDNEFRNSISFNNIASGEYVLEVKAQSSNGVWSAVKTLKINILYPIWQRWWFITACVLLFLTLMYLLYRFRINQLKRVQDLQNSLAADLHDDIGSALSNIEILGFLSQNQLSPEDSGGKVSILIQKIADEAKKTNESLHQLVWTMHTENAGLEPTLAKLNRMAVDSLEPQGITLSVDPLQQDITTIILDREKQRDLIMVFKESLTNIGKYAFATAVHIHIKLENKTLHIDIEDNGQGLKKQQDKVFGGNGLTNMQMRMAKHGGSVTVQNRHNQLGVATNIRLPI